MEERQQAILAAVINEYTETVLPVSSNVLAEKYNFDLSPATIRFEMMELEKGDYLYQPHTSAGRVPTDKGFRYFVDLLMEEKRLSLKEQKILQAELLKSEIKNKILMKTATKLLSAMSENLAMGGIMNSDDFYESGISHLLSQPDFDNLESVARVAEMIDYLAESLNNFSSRQEDDSTIAIYIGGENPICQADDCSIIISNRRLKSGRKGILAIIGPKRMNYARNVSLVDYAGRILSGEEF